MLNTGRDLVWNFVAYWGELLCYSTLSRLCFPSFNRGEERNIYRYTDIDSSFSSLATMSSSSRRLLQGCQVATTSRCSSELTSPLFHDVAVTLKPQRFNATLIHFAAICLASWYDSVPSVQKSVLHYHHAVTRTIQTLPLPTAHRMLKGTDTVK